MKSLKDILYKVEIASVIGTTDLPISSVHFDSRKVKKQSLFVAVKGTITDGHEYILQAIKNGATAIVAEQLPSKTEKNISYIIVKNSSKELAVIATNYFENPSEKLKLIGVTGTNGKTTTARLIDHIFKLAGNTVGMCTTDGVYIKNRLIYRGDMTGPMSHKMVLTDPTVDLAILECARGGILRAGLGFKNCNVGVVTNVSEDHLGLRGIHTVDQLARVKSIIPEIVKQDGVAVLNADDSLVHAMSEKTKGSVIFFSLDWENNPVVSTHLKEGGTAVVFDDGWLCMMKGQWKYPIADVKNVPLTFDGKAKFNIMNALAAAGAAIGLGLKLENIKAGLTTFFPSHAQTPGRLTMTDMGNFNVLVDYAHNKAGYDALIDFVSSYNPEKVIMTLCVPGDRRDEDFESIAESCAKYVDTIVLFESYLRGLDEGELSEKLKKYLIKHGMTEDQIIIIYDEQEAVQYCLDAGGEYDFVILSNYDIDDTHSKVQAHKEKLEQEKSA